MGGWGVRGGEAKAKKAQLTMSSTSELGAQHPPGPTTSQLPHHFGSCIGMWDGLMKSCYDPGSGPGVQVGQLLESDVAEGGWKNTSTQDWPRIAQECVGREEGRDQGQNPDDIRGSGSREGCKVPWRSLLTVHPFRMPQVYPGHSFRVSLAVRCGRAVAFSSVGCRGQCCVPSQPGYALSPSGLHTGGWQSPKVGHETRRVP